MFQLLQGFAVNTAKTLLKPNPAMGLDGTFHFILALVCSPERRVKSQKETCTHNEQSIFIILAINN